MLPLKPISGWLVGVSLLVRRSDRRGSGLIPKTQCDNKLHVVINPFTRSSCYLFPKTWISSLGVFAQPTVDAGM
jgi:hypothetical protein